MPLGQKLSKFDQKELIKYPFLPFLKEYLNSISFNIEEILKSDNEILKESVDRIKKIIAGIKPIYKEDPSKEIPIYVTSLYLASQLGTEVIYRFADVESKRFSDNISIERLEYVIEISKYLVKSEIEVERELKEFTETYRIKIRLIDYLNFAPFLGGYSWALAFKELNQGKVYLNKSDFIRLLEESYRQWIILKANELKEFYYIELEDLLKELMQEVEVKRKYREAKRISYKGVDPPCMRILINDLKSGKKLTHIGRFALVSYLHSIGWDVEDVINIFRSLPDFKEDITRYQVEHIYGLRGGRKVYAVPSCLTMKAASLCFPESPGCDNIKHPLQYIIKINRLSKKIGK